MRLTKTAFKKKYQKPEKWVNGRMSEWYQNILHHNHAEIMLSEIPFGCYTEYYTQGSAYVVTGYKVKVVHRIGDPWVAAAYSPLVGGLIGGGMYSRHYEIKNYINHTTLMSHVPCTPEPLDDETSKLLLMADCLPSIGYTLVKGDPLFKWHFGGADTSDDILLNLVSLIRQQEKEKRDRLMCLFDTYGAPTGLLGEALTHIDKFRSM